MTSPKPNPQLTEAFREALAEEMQGYMTGDAHAIFRMPAKAAEVGEIVVYNDGDELTVQVGFIYHRHYELRTEAGEVGHDDVAEETAGWIEDIVAERVRFRVESQGGKAVAAWCWHSETEDRGRCLEGTDEVREYTWSGEKFYGRPGS